MKNSLRRQCKRLLHNHNRKVTKQECDLCYFENYPRKKKNVRIYCRSLIINFSANRENKNLGGELVGGETPWRRDDR